MPDDTFDPLELADPHIINPVSGDIFEFAPQNCDALALWMLNGTDLIRGWHGFQHRLQQHTQEHGQNTVMRLVADTWHPIQMENCGQLWNTPSGCLLKIAPPLGRLKFIFLIPNIDDRPLDDPTHARFLVMQALEILKDFQAAGIAMNGIHGSTPTIMRNAVEDWIARPDSATVTKIYLVDRIDDFRPDAWTQLMLDVLEWDAGGRLSVEPVMNQYLNGMGPSPERSHVFLDVRENEKNLLRKYCDPAKAWKVLDYGCGVGRHLKWLREYLPTSQLHGIERNVPLMERCQERLPEARFVQTFEEVQDRDFDLVLLLGSNLGMFGGKLGLRRNLRRIHASMRAGGLLVGESNPVSNDCKVGNLKIAYEGCHDSSFQWGFFTRECAKAEIEKAGFTVLPATPERFWWPSGHGDGFIIVAKNSNDGK